MSATQLRDRQAWLFHVHGCASCPDNLCAAGRLLAYAVADGMSAEESWAILDVPATPSRRSQKPFPWVDHAAI